MSTTSTLGPGALLGTLRRTSDTVNRATILVCAVLLAVMLLVSAAGIVLELGLALAGRLGHASLFDSGPLAFAYANTRPSLFRLFLPWLGMLSITVAFKYGEHIAILAVARLLPRWAARLAQAVNLAAIGIFAIALLWYGLGFFREASNLYIISPSLQVAHHWTAASVPVAGAILCLHLVDGMALLEERGAISAAAEEVEAAETELEFGDGPPTGPIDTAGADADDAGPAPARRIAEVAG
ncbi:TRAP transporter small permease [Stappia indica]|uniref:TRAP transporter small permease n=1 Tax=Stappia indica TaxID=538381 RepID=UPI000831E9DC|nr:TRAP transporter small permease subunit [Stappia indica]